MDFTRNWQLFNRIFKKIEIPFIFRSQLLSKEQTRPKVDKIRLFRKELAQPKMDSEILKKAAVYFAKKAMLSTHELKNAGDFFRQL